LILNQLTQGFDSSHPHQNLKKMTYYRPKINFQEKELFQYRFKRKPKVWSLEEIQELWERSLVRYKERQSMINKVYDKIIDEIPEDKNRRKVIYYTENKKVYKYEFSHIHGYKSWSYSLDSVQFSKEKSKSRDEKIEFILSNNRAFELGQEFRDIQKFRPKLQYRVSQIFIREVENKLKEVYKDKYPPDITVVKIGSKKYYFAVDDQHRYDYLEFHFKGLVSNKEVEL
jgi:hypothetical protein